MAYYFYFDETNDTSNWGQYLAIPRHLGWMTSIDPDLLMDRGL